MGKELSEMTLEELWDLFPVFLVRYDEQRNEYYKICMPNYCFPLQAVIDRGLISA